MRAAQARARLFARRWRRFAAASASDTRCPKRTKDPAASAIDTTEISGGERARAQELLEERGGSGVKRVPESSVLVESDAQRAEVDVGERFWKRSLRSSSPRRLYLVGEHFPCFPHGARRKGLDAPSLA